MRGELGWLQSILFLQLRKHLGPVLKKNSFSTIYILNRKEWNWLSVLRSCTSNECLQFILLRRCLEAFFIPKKRKLQLCCGVRHEPIIIYKPERKVKTTYASLSENKETKPIKGNVKDCLRCSSFKLVTNEKKFPKRLGNRDMLS